MKIKVSYFSVGVSILVSERFLEVSCVEPFHRAVESLIFYFAYEEWVSASAAVMYYGEGEETAQGLPINCYDISFIN